MRNLGLVNRLLINFFETNVETNGIAMMNWQRFGLLFFLQFASLTLKQVLTSLKLLALGTGAVFIRIIDCL